LWSHVPMGTREDEMLRANCSTLSGGGELCSVKVTLPSGMRKPMLYYAVGPFYQNYNAYMKSELIPELMGHEVSESQREKSCVAPTRLDSAGEQIVPCGMKATSVFNDTFHVVGHRLLRDHVAWRSDVQRYNNPELDYPGRPNTSWLYERYPEVIPEEQGVKTQSFADWMRPSAVPRVWNRYGYFNQTLEPGAQLEFQIYSHFPINTIPGGYKVLVLTEYSAFGARHNGFGYILIGAGGMCFVLALVAWITYRLLPRGSSWLRHLVEGDHSEGTESLLYGDQSDRSDSDGYSKSSNEC